MVHANSPSTQQAETGDQNLPGLHKKLWSQKKKEGKTKKEGEREK